MIHKKINYHKLRVVLVFTISTFFIGALHFPSQFFISPAYAALPAIALPYAANAALAAGRLVLLNGTRVAATSAAETGGAANAAIYGGAAANDMIYGSIAANAESFIVPSIVSTSGVAASGGINGYLSAAAMGLLTLGTGAMIYQSGDGKTTDLSGVGNTSRQPLVIADSSGHKDYYPARINQAKAEKRDPSVINPHYSPKSVYYFTNAHLNQGVVFDSPGAACDFLPQFHESLKDPKVQCPGALATTIENVRAVGFECHYTVLNHATCDADSAIQRIPSHIPISAAYLSPEKECSAKKGMKLDGDSCVPDYPLDDQFYPDEYYPEGTPSFENRPTDGGSIQPHPSLIPSVNPNTGEISISNSDDPANYTKAKAMDDGSLQVLHDIKGLLIDIRAKITHANQLALDTQKMLSKVVEREIKGAKLKHEEDGTTEPVTIVNNTYFDVAGNEYNVSYIIRENPSSKPLSPGDKVVLPDGTVIEPDYDPSEFPPDEIVTTTKTQPVPNPNPNPNPNPDPNPDPNTNPLPSPVQDTVTKTKIDPRTGDVVEETTTTITNPDGSKDITVTVNIQGDPKSNPDPQPTPEPTEFEWKCGIDGTPACQVTQDVGKFADSDWSDVDVPPANYTDQLKDKLFGNLFNNFTYTPPTSAVCPIATIDLSTVGLSGNYWFSQPYILDYHCKNLLEPLYSELRALFQLGWLLLAIYIVLSA